MALVRRMMECAAERLTEELQKRYRYAQSQMPDSIAEIVLDLLRVLERYLNVGYRNRDFNASLATYLATLSSHHLDGKRARGQKKEFCSDGVLVRRFRRERRIFYQKNTNFACPPSVVFEPRGSYLIMVPKGPQQKTRSPPLSLLQAKGQTAIMTKIMSLQLSVL